MLQHDSRPRGVQSEFFIESRFDLMPRERFEEPGPGIFLLDAGFSCSTSSDTLIFRQNCLEDGVGHLVEVNFSNQKGWRAVIRSSTDKRALAKLKDEHYSCLAECLGEFFAVSQSSRQHNIPDEA